MAYNYDVFLSYNRSHFPHGNWVRNAFFPLFESYLSEALNKDVEIFIDTEAISSGQAWEAKIRQALIHSRVMVSVFSTAYFRSEYCKKEFAAIDYRQRKCGYMTVDNPNGLIVPLKIFDGDLFPKYITANTHIQDFNRFALDGIETSRPPIYFEFQEELKKWTEHVRIAHENSPEWNEDWKQPNWIDDSWTDLSKLNGITSKTAPTL
jgi:hypothetical protein